MGKTGAFIEVLSFIQASILDMGCEALVMRPSKDLRTNPYCRFSYLAKGCGNHPHEIRAPNWQRPVRDVVGSWRGAPEGTSKGVHRLVMGPVWSTNRFPPAPSSLSRRRSTHVRRTDARTSDREHNPSSHECIRLQLMHFPSLRTRGPMSSMHASTG